MSRKVSKPIKGRQLIKRVLIDISTLFISYCVIASETRRPKKKKGYKLEISPQAQYPVTTALCTSHYFMPFYNCTRKIRMKLKYNNY